MVSLLRTYISCCEDRLPYLLGVEDDFGKLAGLGEALDDLVGDVGPQVDAEGKGGVHRLDQVSQLLGALQLHRGKALRVRSREEKRSSAKAAHFHKTETFTIPNQARPQRGNETSLLQKKKKEFFVACGN